MRPRASGEKVFWRAVVVGSEDAMAQVIEFYIPSSYHKNSKWVPKEDRGKVLEFPVAVKKTA